VLACVGGCRAAADAAMVVSTAFPANESQPVCKTEMQHHRLQQKSDCSHVQIIPTVNCGKGDAEGEKRVAGMLKHFRGLVDENAAKSRFLSAFRKKGSKRC